MDQTIKKANSTLGFLCRNIRVGNEETNSTTYFSMVLPILECCSTVLRPYTKEYIQKNEMEQPDMSQTDTEAQVVWSQRLTIYRPTLSIYP